MKKVLSVLAILTVCRISLAQSQPLASWPSLSNMHNTYVGEFVESGGFGVSRVTRSHLPTHLPVEITGKPFIVRGAELIGWFENPSPKVYITANGTPWKMTFTNRVNRAKIPTRDLTALESHALAELRSGKDLSVHRAFLIKLPTVVGALRAQKQCLKCHDGAVGDLLGAFTYRFEIPMDLRNAPTPDPSPPATTNLTVESTITSSKDINFSCGGIAPRR